MSQEERDWLDWLKRARDGKLTQREAADSDGSERAVRKLLRRDSMFTVPRRKGESEQERQAADRLTQLGRGLRNWESAPYWRTRRRPKAAWNVVS